MSDEAKKPDLLYSAKAIAGHLGVPTPTVYHLTETGRIPHFKIGKTLCSTRSSLDAAIENLADSKK